MSKFDAPSMGERRLDRAKQSTINGQAVSRTPEELAELVSATMREAFQLEGTPPAMVPGSLAVEGYILALATLLASNPKTDDAQATIEICAIVAVRLQVRIAEQKRAVEDKRDGIIRPKRGM
jgi:hypothetical protein